jgi:hypothetical protein
MPWGGSKKFTNDLGLLYMVGKTRPYRFCDCLTAIEISIDKMLKK